MYEKILYNNPYGTLEGKASANETVQEVAVDKKAEQKVVRSVPEEVREEILQNPPSQAEVDASIQVVSSTSNVFDSFTQAYGTVSERAQQHIISQVSSIVSSPEVLNNYLMTLRSMHSEEHQEQQEQQALIRDEPKASESTPAPSMPSQTDFPTDCCSWKTLVDLYGCAICLDLLAAPTILPCSHSFCGSCLDSHRTTSDNDSCACPICRQNFESIIFEKLLDDLIVQSVNGLDHLTPEEQVSKAEWKSRRELYLTKSKQSKEEIAASASLNSEEFTEEELAIVNSTFVIAVFVVAVVSIIYLGRMRAK